MDVDDDNLVEAADIGNTGGCPVLAPSPSSNAYFDRPPSPRLPFSVTVLPTFSSFLSRVDSSESESSTLPFLIFTWLLLYPPPIRTGKHGAPSKKKDIRSMAKLLREATSASAPMEDGNAAERLREVNWTTWNCKS